jgi:hypothetical protein
MITGMKVNSEKNGKLSEQILNKSAFFDYSSAITEKRINQYGNKENTVCDNVKWIDIIF